LHKSIHHSTKAAPVQYGCATHLGDHAAPVIRRTRLLTSHHH